MLIINIDELLKQKGKTRNWLSLRTGITYTNISNLANNTTTSIKFDVLEKIMIELECQPNDIIKTTTL